MPSPNVRIGLLIYFVLFLGACLLWRMMRVWKKTKINPLMLQSGLSKDTAHDYVTQHFKWLSLISALIFVYGAVDSRIYSWLIPIPYFLGPGFQYFGWAILGISFVICVVAQTQMGNSWRVGIDFKNRTELVHQGIFRASRNPIFMTMIGTLLGVFLLIPNAWTLVLLIQGYTIVQIQVRLEEQHLATLHGDHYRRYCSQVRRWF